MLSKTSILALRALVYLARQDGACLSPRRIAATLDESPTYLAKALRHLVRAGLLRAEKGARGGVRLTRPPLEITLLAVVEACQGAIVGDFCQSVRPAAEVCGFHRAAAELHQAITSVLSRWTLEDVVATPGPPSGHVPGVACLIVGRGAMMPNPARATLPIGG